MLTVIGIGDEGRQGLGPRALAAINDANILAGDSKLVDQFPEHKGEKLVDLRDVGSFALKIQGEPEKNVVLLTEGDPLFHDMAKSLVSALPSDTIRIIPAVSMMQRAFARIRESWDDAVFISIPQKTIEHVLQTLRRVDKVGIYTDSKNSPEHIANELAKHGMSDLTMYVLENLGGKDERVTSGTIFQIATASFSFPNTVILVRTRGSGERSKSGFGIPDAEFYTTGIVIPCEIRAIALSKLGLSEKSVVWNVGAGCGALSIEACYIARRGGVYSVEKDPENCNCIKKNMEKFRSQNLKLVQGAAPDSFGAIFEDPDSIFFGTADEDVLVAGLDRLGDGGHFVISLTFTGELDRVSAVIDKLGYKFHIVLASVSRGSRGRKGFGLHSLDPYWLIYGSKPGRRSETL